MDNGDTPTETTAPVDTPVDTPAPTDQTDSPVEPTQIPVADESTPVEPVAPETPPEETPVEAPAPDQLPSVEGTPVEVTPVGEQTGEPQPEAPNPVPATAAPDVDQVTINTHLRKVSSDLSSVVDYVENFLVSVDTSDEIRDGLEQVISVVNDQIK